MRRTLFFGRFFQSAALELVLAIWDLILGHGADSDFVYVNQDGTARELSSDEREYLSQDFHGGDGARPYIKGTYAALDGWGSMSGFLLRRRLPRPVTVRPVNPNYRTPSYDPSDDANGSFEAVRRKVLERQREREKAARAVDFELP
jgi:hypothetical protein